SGVSSYINGVAYGNGVYVAVGSAGIVLASTDGSTWTQTAVGTTPLDLNCVTFGNDSFVAAGDHNGPGIILYSANGLDWSIGANPVYKNLRGVTTAPGQFLAVGNDGTILTSTNPAAWSSEADMATIPYTNLRGVAWVNGEYVVVGNAGTILTSFHAISWSSV